MRIPSLLLVLSFFLPTPLFAEEESALPALPEAEIVSVVEEVVIEVVQPIPKESKITLEVDGAAVVEEVQEAVVVDEIIAAVEVQETALVEETADPTTTPGAVEEEVLAAESELVVEETPLVEPDMASTEEPVHETPLTAPDPSPETVVETIAAAVLEPEPAFAFAIETRSIPAKKLSRARGDVTETTALVTAPVTVTPDNETGVLSVAGSCSTEYFVVLLYANAEDYDDNPNSYIFNKAFECLGGSYSYSIADLPSTLESGTYYLLIGGQGTRGSWTPTTGLTEITITKSL